MTRKKLSGDVPRGTPNESFKAAGAKVKETKLPKGGRPRRTKPKS